VVEALHSQTEYADDANGIACAADDETGHEPLPMAIGRAERRLQVRAYSLWTSLLGDRQFPPIAALDLAAQGDLAPHGVLLDFGADPQDPEIRSLGAKLAVEWGPPAAATRLSEAPAGSLLARITDHYREILTHRAPIGFDAEFVNWRGATILYRGILLPFSSDDQTVDHVFGVINWKELADSRMTDELQLQIEGAIEPLRRLRLETVSTPASASEWPEPATRLDDDLAERLRRREAQALRPEGDEFALVLARRLPGGGHALLGEVPGDTRLLEQAARRLLA